MPFCCTIYTKIAYFGILARPNIRIPARGKNAKNAKITLYKGIPENRARQKRQKRLKPPEKPTTPPSVSRAVLSRGVLGEDGGGLTPLTDFTAVIIGGGSSAERSSGRAGVNNRAVYYSFSRRFYTSSRPRKPAP
jgi:hypothetical protein